MIWKRLPASLRGDGLCDALRCGREWEIKYAAGSNELVPAGDDRVLCGEHNAALGEELRKVRQERRERVARGESA